MARVVGQGAGASAPRSEDVARVAGVSRKTVSRVLDDELYVSEEVRTPGSCGGLVARLRLRGGRLDGHRHGPCLAGVGRCVPEGSSVVGYDGNPVFVYAGLAYRRSNSSSAARQIVRIN
jgi:hypothetical protein